MRQPLARCLHSVLRNTTQSAGDDEARFGCILFAADYANISVQGKTCMNDAKRWHETAAAINPKTRLFIDGKFVEAVDGQRFNPVNPATGQPITEMALGTAKDIDLAVKAARWAYKNSVWSRKSPRDGMDVRYRIAQLMAIHADELVLLDCLDTGKPRDRSPITDEEDTAQLAAARHHIELRPCGAARKLAKLYPRLAGHPFERARWGRSGMASDHLPKVTMLGPHGVAIYGYSGRRNRPGWVFGKAAAKWAVTGAVEAFPVTVIDQRLESFTSVKQHYHELGSAMTHLVSARL